jgi:hypothetical protein
MTGQLMTVHRTLTPGWHPTLRNFTLAWAANEKSSQMMTAFMGRSALARSFLDGDLVGFS